MPEHLTESAVTETAREAYRIGLTVIPPREDGTKAPQAVGGTWKQFQTERPSAEQMRSWYVDSNAAGVGLATGIGGLECFEFDDLDAYTLFCDTAEAAGLGDVINRIREGYEERTPSGGYHWLWFSDMVGGSEKLARRESDELDENGRPIIETLIETKGVGGYVIISPSGGPVHPSRKSYRLERGSLSTIATVTAEEREILFSIAHAMDEMPKLEFAARAPREHDGDRPGDEFNERGPNWGEILEPHGWTPVYRRGKTEYWRRPGKNIGVSATINGAGIEPDRLYVFTSSTTFEPSRSYSKYQAFTVLEHDGDFSASARHLASEGYGAQPDSASLVFSNGHKPDPKAVAETIAQFNLTDTGNAERLVSMFGDRIRFVTAWEKWLAFDGHRWAIDDKRQMERAAKAVARAIADDGDELIEKAGNDEKKLKLAGAVKAHARRSESTAAKKAMLVSAQAEPGIVIPHDDLDADPFLANVENGTVDLRTGIVREHRRDDYLSKMASCEAAESSDCPTWLSFLDRTFNGKSDLIGFVQRALGYSLTGDTSEQVIFIAYGTGANGKSTLLNVIMELFGDYARQTPTETLLIRRTEAIPNDLAALRGARFVGAIESDEGKRLSEAIVKQLTGGDRISARFMRGEWFEFKPTFKIWLATNHKPEIRGTDHAIWRRIRLIPFSVTIPEHERDPELPQKLLAEGPGIMRWVLDGAREWYEQGLGEPAEVRAATQGYRDEMDVLGAWIKECCDLFPTAEERSSDLYASYTRWSQTNGIDPVSSVRFAARLTERGFTKKKASVVLWEGITLKPDAALLFQREG